MKKNEFYMHINNNTNFFFYLIIIYCEILFFSVIKLNLFKCNDMVIFINNVSLFHNVSKKYTF